MLPSGPGAGKSPPSHIQIPVPPPTNAPDSPTLSRSRPSALVPGKEDPRLWRHRQGTSGSSSTPNPTVNQSQGDIERFESEHDLHHEIEDHEFHVGGDGMSRSASRDRSDGGRWKLFELRIPGASAGGATGGAGTIRRTATSPVQQAVNMAVSLISALWVHDSDQHHAHPHSDSDIPLAPSAPTNSAFATLRRTFYRPKHLLQLSRFGYTVVLVLLFLGLRELPLFHSSPTSASSSIRVSSKRPWESLAKLSSRNTVLRKRDVGGPSSGLQEKLWKIPKSSLEEGTAMALEEVVGGEGDTTAIVLHWKRTENVVLIVTHLCQYSFFDTVLVWNNNPDIHLTRKHFASTLCPTPKLRIYNSPQNLLFFARYLACSHASTPNCYFQDDDWLVSPIRSLYSQFARDPEGPIVVHTSPDVSLLYGLEWCFYRTPLHTCFSWVGTGAFVSRSHIHRFLGTISTLPYTRELLGHADNSFALFQNEPPYVISSELNQLPSPYGHSDGEGIKRNKKFIQQGLVHLSSYLALPASPSFTLPEAPTAVNTTTYHLPQIPPLAPHPWAHHARSPLLGDTGVFITNLHLLPPPDSVTYPGPAAVDLQAWEEHLGAFARGWVEGGELFEKEEAWARKWPYAHAVDGRMETAFRSVDVVKRDDYIGIGLLEQLDSGWVEKVDLRYVLEDVDHLMAGLDVEVSIDGFRWFTPPSYTVPVCTTIRSPSLLPSPSFPFTSFSSISTLTLLSAELSDNPNFLSKWWKKRRRALKECVIQVGSEVVKGGNGWRFVRLTWTKEEEAKVGWGVYEIWVS